MLPSGALSVVGEREGVRCEGLLSDRQIIRDTTRGDGPSRRGLAVRGIALPLVGASLTLLVRGRGRPAFPARRGKAECPAPVVRGTRL